MAGRQRSLAAQVEQLQGPSEDTRKQRALEQRVEEIRADFERFCGRELRERTADVYQ